MLFRDFCGSVDDTAYNKGDNVRKRTAKPRVDSSTSASLYSPVCGEYTDDVVQPYLAERQKEKLCRNGCMEADIFIDMHNLWNICFIS